MQATWQAKPHTSHTTPWRLSPTISDVQWLHFNGDENDRTRNWCDFDLSDKVDVNGDDSGSDAADADGDGWCTTRSWR